MKIYRLSKKEFINDLSGKGAEKYGGRWNSKGTVIIYTSDSRALCTAEVAVHFPLGIIPVDYFISTIEIPENVSMKEISPKSLPDNWKSFPHSHSTQQIGDDFVIKNLHLVLKVPSAVIQGDYNFLINPYHTDFKKIKILNIEPFDFDKRLFKI